MTDWLLKRLKLTDQYWWGKKAWRQIIAHKVFLQAMVETILLRDNFFVCLWWFFYPWCDCIQNPKSKIQKRQKKKKKKKLIYSKNNKYMASILL